MKSVYYFGSGKADGKAEMKNLLGGKGANLAEMTNLDIPVPPGLTITTEVCTYYYDNSYNFPSDLEEQVKNAINKIETVMDKTFGDPENPLLLSVRSGARMSMPGMMETVLNVGLTSKTIPGLIKKTNNPRFVYDAYRRLIMMYSDVVMEKAAGLEPKEGHGIRHQLEAILDEYKVKNGYKSDIDLSGDDWQNISKEFKIRIKDVLGHEFPDNHYDQLWGGIKAGFQSWNGKRAISYRKIENIPGEWGTAVNVQAMVFGNTGDNSATGVAFTRNPATGENNFYGEWLQNAQGEDVVAGIRTPHPLNQSTKTEESKNLESLEEFLPDVYDQLDLIRQKLEKHYNDMQDIEFTIEEGRLWMLQTRSGKRTGAAAIKIAVDMVEEEMLSKQDAIIRVTPDQIDELLHPKLHMEDEGASTILARGLPAGPGGGVGQVVFSADDAEKWHKDGKTIILVREETSPEDVHGMHVAEAILTAKGGMTSHAALVARGWGKCCIVGCSSINIDFIKKEMMINNQTVKEGDWISMNGSKGTIYPGKIKLEPADPESNSSYKRLMSWADELRTLKIRTNADSPEDAKQAIEFGAQGIGLCRTEHMFFAPNRIIEMRKMILAEDISKRREAVMNLLPFQREDFKGILKAMEGMPVTIRLLDPPLHEFITLDKPQIEELANELEISVSKVKNRINSLHELNPMLGHRGCRLGVAYPEITEMQARAIFEASAELTEEGIIVMPEVMIPLVGTSAEFDHQENLVREVASNVINETGTSFKYLVGTMIELPRACLTADEIAEKAEFFSFGTNDLTQTTYGFSRDDIGGFLPDYLEKNILSHDPFQSLDISGVGQLISLAVDKGKKIKKDLKIGICGEHGGDPNSINFCYQNGLDYVSCSPFRVPIARFSAAQAALKN